MGTSPVILAITYVASAALPARSSGAPDLKPGYTLCRFRSTPAPASGFPKITGKTELMRLDKFLSQQLGISRALVIRELRAKRVTIDGDIVKQGAFQLLAQHEVRFDDQVLHQILAPRYFMLHNRRAMSIPPTIPI